MIEDLKPLLKKLTIFAKDNLKFERPPRLFLRSDEQNSQCALGKTAHYDPSKSAITLYISKRHPKDILRSYAHELVHHCQNERGDLSPEKMKTVTKNYAQENDHMRKMEQEAYLMGNMCFRDWEDGLDDKTQYKITLAEQKFLKESKKMSVKITKQFLKETIEKLLSERVKRDSEDRVGGRRAGGRRVKPLEEESMTADQLQQRISNLEFDLEDENTPEEKKRGLRNQKAALEKRLKRLLASSSKAPVSESDSAFAPSHYCIHHGGVQHEGRIVKAEAVQHVEPDENGFISHYDMKLEDGTILEDVAAEDIQVTNASLMNEHGGEGDPKKADGKSHKPMKPKNSVRAKDENETNEGKKKKLKNPKKADLNKDGKLSKYERKRGAAIEKSMAAENINTPEGENKLYEERFKARNGRLFEKLLKEWTK